MPILLAVGITEYSVIKCGPSSVIFPLFPYWLCTGPTNETLTYPANILRLLCSVFLRKNDTPCVVLTELEEVAASLPYRIHLYNSAYTDVTADITVSFLEKS